MIHISQFFVFACMMAVLTALPLGDSYGSDSFDTEKRSPGARERNFKPFMRVGRDVKNSGPFLHYGNGQARNSAFFGKGMKLLRLGKRSVFDELNEIPDKLERSQGSSARLRTGKRLNGNWPTFFDTQGLDGVWLAVEADDDLPYDGGLPLQADFSAANKRSDKGLHALPPIFG